MADILKQKDSELTNFKVAAGTLDASTKIYAVRVDAVHADAYRVLGGLGAETKPGEGRGAEEDGDDAAAEGECTAKQPKKKRPPKKTVEQNLSNINSTESERSKSALSACSKKTTLPASFQFPPETLSQLSLKPSSSLCQESERRLSGELGEGIGDYDYNNANDTINFCPGLQDGDSDDDDVNAFAASGDAPPPGEGIPSPSEDPAGVSTYREEDLVPEPHRVNKIEINYAKMAKKMDMRRLKNSMWTLLTESPEKQTEQVKEAAEAPEVCGEKVFSQTTKNLLQRLPSMMAQNLSVPLAFVALLHLANEKNLELVKVDDMSDIIIRQGQ
uniref:Condensin complex subunit 2 n=1 Tax=Nothobranchius kuhntae TaxID=321403 RepID=A0A1A8KTD9_NOTKU